MLKTPHALRLTLHALTPYAYEPDRRDMLNVKTRPLFRLNVKTRPLFRRCQMWRPDPFLALFFLPNVEQYS